MSRGTDPLDHLRLSCTEGNVVATKVAKAAYDYAKAEIARLTADLDRERKPWSVTLVADGEHSRCEVIDIGHADRILLVRCDDLDRLISRGGAD